LIKLQKAFSKKIASYLNSLWQKSINFSSLSFKEKIVFKILCFIEFFYKAGFFCVSNFKKQFYKQSKFPFKVFSVGNLSVGGTGKSVFVQFIINNLTNFNGAIVLRGYKSKNEKSGESFIVSDGHRLFCEGVSFCGDEAFMMSQLLDVPVVVGANRAKSCELLNNYFLKKEKKIDFVVLDDAYQNNKVKKDFEILLLDARKPLENGHCLPAGRLRENDYSRANAIVLTHANFVKPSSLEKTKNKLLKNFSYENIFSGKHGFSHLTLLNSGETDLNYVKNKRFLIFAGIGTFEYFKESVRQLNVDIFKSIEYPDHHKYSSKDLNTIIETIKNNSLFGAITTQKDWSKLFPLLKKIKGWEKLPIYILNVSFEFLTDTNKKHFLAKLNKELKN